MSLVPPGVPHPLVEQWCADFLEAYEKDREYRTSRRIVAERDATIERHPAGSKLPSPAEHVAEFDDRNDATVIDLFTGRRQS
ncbi:hypothetical protein GCM10008944_01290 [Cytobacillus oceanisediminis]